MLSDERRRKILKVERRMQLVPRDVEVEQALVLVLDFLIALAKVLVLPVQGLELGLDLLELPAQLQILADHVVLAVGRGTRHSGEFLLQVKDLVAQALVLTHDLLEENLAAGVRPHRAVGAGEKLLGVLLFLLAHRPVPSGL